MIDARREGLSVCSLFPVAPEFKFQPDADVCPCGGALKAYKTQRRTVVTLHIGKFHAVLRYRYCSWCGNVLRPEELDRLVAPHCKFGFDVIEYIGRARFERSQSQHAIQCELKTLHVDISLREIEVLCRRFIVYLAQAHRNSESLLKQFMEASNGGYILHTDGTCEGSSPHLMCCIDGLSGLVLGNIKIPSENSAGIIPFLQGIRSAYGDPVCLVHDMGAAIIKAAEEVFPDVPDTICHFHFLRDIGKDLMSGEYDTIRRRMRKHNVRGTLRKMIRELKAEIEDNPVWMDSLNSYLRANEAQREEMNLSAILEAYLLVAWIVEATSQSDGLGFPFDRPHLDIYQRLAQAYPVLKKLKTQMSSPLSMKIILLPLYDALNDSVVLNRVSSIQGKMEVFDRLRDAMRIALPDSNSGLNDTGETDIRTIRERVTAFRNDEQIERLGAEEKDYAKMIKQIDKYWGKLFTEPLIVICARGTIEIQPQRTNNLMEQFFRGMKRDERRKGGNCSLERTLTTMAKDVPLSRNLGNSDYIQIILKGEETLAQCFANLDGKVIRKGVKDVKKAVRKYPENMRKIFNIPDLPARLNHFPYSNPGKEKPESNQTLHP